MINDKADEVMRELFKSLKNRYQITCHEINPNRRESYRYSADSRKSKKTTRIPINKKDNKYFQTTVTVTLNHE